MHRHAGRDQLWRWRSPSPRPRSAMVWPAYAKRHAIGIAAVEQTWTPVGRRARFASESGSTRTTPSTRPRSITSCISLRWRGAMMNRPEPKNCEAARGCGTVIFLHPSGDRALFTSGWRHTRRSAAASKAEKQQSRIRGSRTPAEFLADDSPDALSHTCLMRSFASAFARPKNSHGV
jgi:hypothetical protein